jgi:hypothetical protein
LIDDETGSERLNNLLGVKLVVEMEPSVVVHACNPSTQEAEAGECLKPSLGYIARPCQKQERGWVGRKEGRKEGGREGGRSGI